jgi:uncharacterized membrane protein
MAPDEHDLRLRIERLEAEVAELRWKVASRTPPRPESGAPPVMSPPPRPDRPAPSIYVPTQAPQPAPPSVDSELQFGSQVLPRVGIVLVLLAVFYLVGLAIQRGWITPEVQFVGELLLCAGLIGVGVWKLNEREDFGQVLVGGGSCGLYLSFVGAHVYKDLITGETLVSLFVALSLMNLAFSWWRSSRTFWMIGFVGGLVSAGFPLDRDNYTAALVLAALIVLPATLLAGYRQWMKAIAGLWFVSSVFVFAVVFNALDDGAMPVPAALTAFMCFSIVPIAAHAWRFVSSEFDPKGWFALAAGSLTCGGVFAFGDDVLPVPHSVAIVAFSAALLAIAAVVRKQVQAQMLVMTAVATATVLAPVGFTSFQACLTYAVLSLVGSGLVAFNVGGLQRVAPFFAAGHVVLAGAAYGISMFDKAPPTGTEYVMLVAVAASLSALCVVVGRLERQFENGVAIATVLLFPLVSRAAYIAVTGEPQAFRAMLFGQAMFALVLAAFSERAKWGTTGAVSMALAATTALVYAVGLSETRVPIEAGWQIAVCAMLIAAVVGGVLSHSRDKVTLQASEAVGAAIGWALVSRLLFLVLTLPAIGMETQPAVTLSWGLYGGMLIALGFLLEQKVLRIASFVAFAVTIVKIVLVDLSELDPMLKVLVLIVLGSIMILGGYIYVRRRNAAG